MIARGKRGAERSASPLVHKINSRKPGATRLAVLGACPWLSYFAPLALAQMIPAFEQASALHWIRNLNPETKEFLMWVRYTHFSDGAVIRERYREGVDYLDHHFDLEFDDTLHLLKELKNDRCRLCIQTRKHGLLFFIDSEKNLWVDLDDVNGLWAQSEVSLEAATEIIRIAFDGGEFDELIPTTSKEWDAYAWPFKYDS